MAVKETYHACLIHLLAIKTLNSRAHAYYHFLRHNTRRLYAGSWKKVTGSI